MQQQPQIDSVRLLRAIKHIEAEQRQADAILRALDHPQVRAVVRDLVRGELERRND